jgi:ADP-ribose pyrophosphatase YjhB (NUDIX family)
MDDFPPIDSIARRLLQLGALLPGQEAEFKRLEMSAIASARSEDALMLFGRLDANDPAKKAMQSGLDDLRSWAKGRVEAAQAGRPPKLRLVSGAPGAGKSSLMARLEESMPGALMASADDFKARFKRQSGAALEEVAEPARSNLGRSVYIHRLTALPSWEMVDEALEARKDVVVELLGLGAAEDARTARRALALGYDVEVLHVGCSAEQALARATRRHFDMKAAGGEGRWVGLAAAAGRQREILSSFATLCELLEGTPARLALFDNTEFQMELVWTSQEQGPPPIGRFAGWARDPKLWWEGANPAADAIVLAQDEEGAWRVALIERSNEPFAGHWSFPGGFSRDGGGGARFERGQETPEQTARRRLSEEALCDEPVELTLMAKLDAMERDPRNDAGRWVESWIFAGVMARMVPLAGGDAARKARWAPVAEVFSGQAPMAFDHRQLLVEALEMARLGRLPQTAPAGPRKMAP